ncbi:MAG: TetR/AcrR family transcriptional regulator [Catenulispora sp.]
MSTDTRTRLLQGAVDALRTQGIAGVSARTIAAAAGVNQALVFYHFGSVDELVAAAALWSTERRVAESRDRLRQVRSLRELLAVGRELWAKESAADEVEALGQALTGAQGDSVLAAAAKESAAGEVEVLGQVLTGAQTNPVLAVAARDALAVWTGEIEQVLTRVLADSVLGEVADVPGLARAVAASFVGMELAAAVDPDGGAAAFRALDQLGAVLEGLDELEPATRRDVRLTVRRSVRKKGGGAEA